MLELLLATVVIVGMVGVLNLLLTFGVIRRLREHNELLSSGAGGARPITTMLAVGESVAPFSATTVDGRSISRDQLAGPILIGVFAAGCEACREYLPNFVESAAVYPGGRQQVLAVVVAHDDSAAAPYVDELAEIANVVRDVRGGPTLTALGVKGYPAFAIVDHEGKVRASAIDPVKLGIPARGIAAVR
jgi:thiol-disulfide isomerase/thioredoxin